LIILSYVRELNGSHAKAAKYVSNHIRESTDYRRSYESRGLIKKTFKRAFSCTTNGYFLTISYFFVKILYALVALSQVYILNYWFRDDFHRSKSVWSVFFGEHNLRLSERFPRMTLCKFQVYILNDSQNHVIL